MGLTSSPDPHAAAGVQVNHHAAAGVDDSSLCALLSDHWEATLRRAPLWASRLGDRRYSSLLPRTHPDEHSDRRTEREGFLARARTIDSDALGPADRLTLGLFIEDLESSGEVDAHRMEEWMLLPRGNPLTLLGRLPEIRPLHSAEEGAGLLARYRALPEFLAGDIETLGIGIAAGKIASAESARRILEMARTELGKPTDDWAAVARISFARDAVAKEERTAIRDEARTIADDVLRPAIERYAGFLEEQILPLARTGDHVGLSGLPGGTDCYVALIRRHTSLPRSAEDIHSVGLEELTKIHAEFADRGERVFGTREISRIFTRLRTDPGLYFETEKEVEAKARAALASARAAMGDWFGRLPKADCVVKRVPEHEAPYTTVAYYRPPAAEGSRPGEYRINAHAPRTRPRHEAEALAFHEAIPGHHLQIAVAQELSELPAFRRHGSVTAYVEGWALYAERLADEMGLYSGDEDRLGMLSFDAWRAARLVVDTGIHRDGWSRERAVAFMQANTPLAPNNIDNEVDRYVSWPGQALSYKIGQIEMWRIRRETEAVLGDRFDIRSFHDAVLGSGPLPLGILRSRMRRWAKMEAGAL